MISGTDLLQALPLAVYTTDPEGRITFYNEAAAEFWGHRPALGVDLWCGSWRLFWPDGSPMPHDECPMATALRDGVELRDVEAIAERPDGTRIPFVPYPTLLRDSSGRVTGAINLLVDISDRKHGEMESARLAAIVTSSDDAIVSKTLQGYVTTWNAGATRIFGYEPEEMIGEHITKIIPTELRSEEEMIIGKIQRGEPVEHYETVRVGKGGRRIDISLTVSPLRDRSGRIIGASKVARDISMRKRSDRLQRLLFDELNHRVKNTLAMVQAIASQSLHMASSPSDFVTGFSGRVQALARAHDLLVRGDMRSAGVHDIVREQVALGSGNRVAVAGPRLELDPKTAVQLGLVLHELATNARKYGALSVPDGRLSISWGIQASHDRELFLEWIETGVPNVRVPTRRGFGTTLIERTLEAHGGQAVIRYRPEGVACDIRLPLPDQDSLARAVHADGNWEEGAVKPASGDTHDLGGKRILLVEDEPLIAMEIESVLTSLGCVIAGSAGTIEKARQLIAETQFDAALLDANLAGRPVHELAAALTQKGVPFAFATGYGREGVPAGFQHAPLLSKPFGPDQLAAVLKNMLAPGRSTPDVIPIGQRRGRGSAPGAG